MRRRGNVLVIVAVAMTALAGSAACVVDLAMGHAERARQQAAADAGALAASFHLAPPADAAAAKQAAIDWVAENGYAITAADVSVWDRPGGGKAVTVKVHQPVDTTFARLLGLERLEVEAAASAGLGGVAEMPKGWLPLAVPAYRESGGAKDWFVKSDPNGGYARLTADPALGGPTRIVLRETKGSSGNYQSLAIGGAGVPGYKQNLVSGVAFAATLPAEFDTEPGKMGDHTIDALEERLRRMGEAGRMILVPLVERDEWEDAKGRTRLQVVGYASARLDDLDGAGQLTATFVSRVIAGQASKAANVSPGVYAPALIANP